MEKTLSNAAAAAAAATKARQHSQNAVNELEDQQHCILYVHMADMLVLE